MSLDNKPTASQGIGKLWWNADSLVEARQWQSEYLAKGAIAVELKPEDDREVVGVFITLERERSMEILGCEVGEEEWLDLSEDDGGEQKQVEALAA